MNERVRRAMSCLTACVAFHASVATASEKKSTYKLILDSKTCAPASFDKNQLDCEYRIGDALHFVIAGVGDPTASVNFFKSNFEADYWAAFGMMHLCVVVKPKVGSSLAFISPKNGKVYEGFEACAAGK